MLQKTFFIITLVILSAGLAQGSDFCASFYSSVHLHLPTSLAKQFPVLAASQPTTLNLLGHPTKVYNKQIAQFIQQQGNQPSRHSLAQFASLLHRRNLFKIPMTDQGFVPAVSGAHNSSGYDAYIWHRDMARISTGISSLPKLLRMLNENDQDAFLAGPKLKSAMLKIFVEEKQIARTLKNIIDPEFHRDPQNGFRNVIFIRLNFEARAKGKELSPQELEAESRWGHKQNDALALYAHSILDGIASSEISLRDLTTDMKAELIYLAAYFQRVRYFSMEDVGAWEEQMGVRTSSIGLVTSFLERFYNGWTNSNKDVSVHERAFFGSLKREWEQGHIRNHIESFVSRHSGEFNVSPNHAWLILVESLKQIDETIDKAYEVIKKRLGIYRDTQEIVEVEGARGEDAALLHLALYPPRRLTVKDRLKIVEKLKLRLLRESGFARYENDWFLYANPNAAKVVDRLPFDPEMLAINDGGTYRQSTEGDRNQMQSEYQRQIDNKDMSGVIRIAGANQEAQWSFQDAILSQVYIQIFKETGDKRHLKQAWFHLARALASVTGENQINIEGDSIQPFTMPEAWIPVRLVHKGQAVTTYFSSPNTPLNWATAELITAITKFLEVSRD